MALVDNNKTNEESTGETLNEPSEELRLLETACSYASISIGTQALLLLLENLIKRQEAIAHVQRRFPSFVICSSSIGDVYVPINLMQLGEIEEEGSSWLLSVVASQRHKTQWRALSATRNVDGWKSVENVRRSAGPRTGHKGGQRDRPQYRGSAERATATQREHYKGGARSRDSH